MSGRPDKINKPIWIEHTATDLDGAKTFYKSLFGWETQELGPEAGNYAFFNLNGQMVGGVGPPQGESPEQPATWMPYVGTEDVDASLEAIKQNGGDIVVGGMDVLDTGRFGVFRDPGGAVLGLWQPKTMSGFRVENQPGAFGWFELNTPDLDTAKRFYGTVFGWTTKDSEGPPPYTEWQVDGDSIGGALTIGEQMSADTPPFWMTYFVSEDVDATATKATELGGKVMTGPMEYPGGRFAIIQDPQGRVPFGVITIPQQQ
jgi:predicted enzyme related to lactoylglutathione lyase